MRQLLRAGGEVDLFEAYSRPGPGLRVNFVSSADGAATIDGRSEGLSSPADKLLFRALRAMADVVVVGAGTARIEGYGPVKLSAEHQAWRTSQGMPPVPPLAVVSGSLALDPASRLFAEAAVRPLVLTGGHPALPAARALSVVADLIIGNSATAWVAELAGRGLTRILCEGGPRLFGTLLTADLVDELCLTIAPLLGRRPAPGIAEQAAGAVPTRLRLLHVLEDDGFLFLRYVARRS
ncbi:MAG: pyrimidine reductase family protein [Pseudonocardiales bacterium]